LENEHSARTKHITAGKATAAVDTLETAMKIFSKHCHVVGKSGQKNKFACSLYVKVQRQGGTPKRSKTSIMPVFMTYYKCPNNMRNEWQK
jgi:hypothetical protein